jgi:hypothetical protein
MLDIIIYFFLKYSYLIAVLLFLIKIFLFFKNKNKNWTVVEFLYFKPTNIQFTSNAERAKLKKVQNQLSIAIIVFLVIQVVVALIF